jgi:ABC-type nickel/cobalt efflux system permease component RcnA
MMQMSGALLATAGGLSWALVATALTFGLRHGVDWDHLAAITDLTSNGQDRRRSMILATMYAAGHAAVVVVLGSVAVVAGDYVPESVDSVMGRVVGVTLLLLGGYVLVGLARDRGRFRMRSRWMLLGSLVRRRRAREVVVVEHDHEHTHEAGARHGHGHAHSMADDHVRSDAAAVTTTNRHQHLHVHVGSMPDDPGGPRRRTALGIGALHGVGAETPTQVVLFATAASVAGSAPGLLLLFVFTLGVFVSNTAIALAATAGFLRAEGRFWLYGALAATTGAFSIALGLTYVLGFDVLPPILT